jgi:hypothetical protein
MSSTMRTVTLALQLARAPLGNAYKYGRYPHTKHSNFAMADSSAPQSPAAFAESALAALLSAPHISLPRGPSGIRMGPGPIDLFSTKFNNTFTAEAMGVIDGKQVDREELKEGLLALQSHYDPDTAKFQSEDLKPYGEVCGN